ncbi:MAG: amidohydrolase family protein [Acidobacteriota bacterium]|nr:amidohydrolase family protein [Acidobacteriota bacterium]
MLTFSLAARFRLSSPSPFLIGLFCFATIVSANARSAVTADTVIVNARIYTVNAARPWAEALAISGDKILAVGNTTEIAAYRDSSTKVIDAKGQLVLPGFTDCHIHFMDGSLGLTQVDLNETKSVAEIQKRVKDYATANPDKKWILGMGWTYPTFGPSALPDKKFLDEVVPDRPVFLQAFDGHSSWANSKALELAGITRETPDPPNGQIVRDQNGEATGALKEVAGDLVAKFAPKPTHEERLTALRLGMHEANKAGLVRVHSAGQDFEWLDLYNELRQQQQLSLRFYIAYFLDPPELTPDAVEKIEQARRTYHDDWISGGVVKTMLDGVVEAHTAALLEPYTDDPAHIGKLFWDPTKYKQAIAELDRRELQIFTHAIGDKAVRLALDAYQQAQETNHTRDLRPRIEHIETISAQDIPRFGKQGVIASFQPLHAYPDEDTLGIWARNVGKERAQRAWVWHSIESTGGVLAFGSDWPVVTLNPWYGLQNAVTRKTREGKPEEGFVPQERVSLENAIKAYTLGAAFAGHREKTEGSIESGKLADLIILSQDLFKIKPNEIAHTEVSLTMVGGRVVYQSPAWDGNQKSAMGKH